MERLDMAKAKLTAKQEQFCQEYLIDLNATQAAIRAGYAEKTARTIAAQNLAKLNIDNRIQELQAKRAERVEINADDVVKELAILAFSDLQNYITIGADSGAIQALGFEDMPLNASRALESIQEDRAIKESNDGDQVIIYDKIKFKTHSKIKALELLGKHFGMFNEKKDDEKAPVNIYNIIGGPNGDSIDKLKRDLERDAGILRIKVPTSDRL